MDEQDPYAARHSYFAHAKGHVTPRNILLGLFLIAIAWLFGGLYLIPWPMSETGTAFRTFAVHMTFLILAGSTFWVVSSLHKRNPVALLGPLETLATDFGRVVQVLAILTAVLYLIPGYAWDDFLRTMPVPQWLSLLPIACVAVLVQTSAEEILYRGYLQQSIGAISDNPLAWMVLPSVLFGLSHYNPDIPFSSTSSHIIWTTFFGIAAADLTARTGSLGAAIGLHFVYNLPLVILTSVSGELSGFSLLHYPQDIVEAPRTAMTLFIELFFLWMLWMGCRIAIRR